MRQLDGLPIGQSANRLIGKLTKLYYIVIINKLSIMEEFVKVVEQILYMENFNIEITPDLKQKFAQMYGTFAAGVPEKYKGDVARLANKYAAVGANAFSFSY